MPPSIPAYAMQLAASWGFGETPPPAAVAADPVAAPPLAAIVLGLLTCLAWWARSKLLSMDEAGRTPPFEGIPLAPRGHWLFGHLFAMGGNGDFRRGQANVLVNPADPDTGLSSFWFVGVPAVSVLRGADVRSALSASSFRRPIALLQRHTDMFLGSHALTGLMGREWRHYRSAVHRSFTPSALAESQEAINEVGNTLAASLRRASAEAGGGRGLVSKVLPLMKMATIDVFGRASLGVDLGCCSALRPSPVAEAFDFLTDEYSRRIGRPLDPTATFYFLPTAANRRHARERRLIRGFISDLLAGGRRDLAEGREGRKSEFLTRLLKAAGEKGDGGKGGAMSDGILSDILMVLLFGGYDTTSITLTYALHLLASHPKVQAMVSAEIAEVLGGPRSGIGGEDEPGPVLLDDPAGLPLTRAVILETLRLYPPAPVTTRNLEKPLELHGTVLPPGTMIFIGVWSIQRDARNYPMPEDFRPDRWVRRGEKGTKWVERAEGDDGGGIECGAKTVPPASRDAFCAFSGGARNCVGRALAMQEAVTLLACLLRDLRFEAVPDYVLRPQSSSFVQNPHDGLPMEIKPREAPAVGRHGH